MSFSVVSPVVLAFDTSAAHCAVALVCGDRIASVKVRQMGKGQAEYLMPLCEEVLQEAAQTWQSLDGVGVGIGPGNFTGIRVCVSAARGLAVALGKPAIGVSVLEAQVFGAPMLAGGGNLASVKAPRGAFYLQLFSPEPVGEIALSAPQELPPGCSAAAQVFGDGRELIAQHTAAVATPSPCPLPVAIAHIAARRMSDAQPHMRPSPLYIRPADAMPPRDAGLVVLT